MVTGEGIDTPHNVFNRSMATFFGSWTQRRSRNIGYVITQVGNQP